MFPLDGFGKSCVSRSLGVIGLAFLTSLHRGTAGSTATGTPQSRDVQEAPQGVDVYHGFGGVHLVHLVVLDGFYGFVDDFCCFFWLVWVFLLCFALFGWVGSESWFSESFLGWTALTRGFRTGGFWFWAMLGLLAMGFQPQGDHWVVFSGGFLNLPINKVLEVPFFEAFFCGICLLCF